MSKVSFHFAPNTLLQQHGSVYWKKGAREMLRTLDPAKFLHDQLPFAFSVTHSPIWMDSSTTEYCDKLEKFIGGSEVLIFCYYLHMTCIICQ